MLTAPGTQIMKPDEAVGFAAYSNDYLADAVRKHPTRFAGFTAVAPQRPADAAKEIQRGHNQLGMKGVIVNSHTRGEYLDDPKFWPIFEAAEALDTPLYIHPTALPKSWGLPFMERGLDGAIYGFGVDVALHVLRIMAAGVFDRFPRLQIGIGHMGEALPFWLYRIDYMHRQTVIAKRYEAMKPLQRKPSEYLCENMFITNSGVAWEPAVKFTQQVVGVDRVLYAQDYPYQYVLDEVRALDAMDMPASDKKAFFQTNAERIFKLV
jgi:2,3-dihydroxybenzoate decarboxylase